MATAWSQRPLGGGGDKNNSSSVSKTKNRMNQQQQQQELYGKLREYETRRRLAYSAKYDSISLYWKSYCDLLSASLKETSRAQRIVLGTAHAYLMYAEAMQAISEDTFLDDKGNITNDKQKKKVASTRKKIDGATRTNTSEAKNAVSVLKEIREAQSVLAERFEESSQNMDEEIAAAIGQLLDTVQESFVTIERLGSSILTELEKTEQEVTQAWGTYLNTNSSAGTGASGVRGKEEMNPKSAVDQWVVEMQYRVAVAYQNMAWDKGNEELQELFKKVKKEEITRRMNLREFLVAFAQRQQRLFLSLPEIQNKVVEELVGKEMSREEVDKAVRTIIEERAAKYKKETVKGSDLTEDDFADFNLESPLASDLLSKAKVVLRKGSGLDWTLSLAVMTADSYLHLFDIESSNIKLTTSPEVAFTALAPNLVIPNPENRLLGKSNFGKGWSDPLTPSESMILGKCKVKQLDEISFELIETVSISGASKFIGKTSKRRVQIQTPTTEETEDWIQILTA